VEFIKKHAYIILGAMCVLALGGLYLISRNRPARIVDAGSPLVPRALADEPSENPPTVQDTADPPVAPAPPAQDVPETFAEGSGMVVVHIVGAVRYPGVYEVPYGSRINYVLQLAGGYSEDANQGQVNLSAFVVDAMQIRIPAIGEELEDALSTESPGQQNQVAVSPDGVVNINLATLTELQTLPGIGPVIAQNIIDYREANSGFNSIEELLNVSRIGASTLENIRGSVTVD